MQDATPDELARAVRHSTVIIDAKKHELNYEQSYINNNIGELKLKYQGRTNAGASTLISKASSTQRVPDRKDGAIFKDRETGKKKTVYVDPLTGEKLYTETGATYKKPQIDTNEHTKRNLQKDSKQAGSLCTGIKAESGKSV